MVLFIVGIVLGALTIAGILTIFIFLIKKQERLKKLPIWIYILSIALLLCAITSIALVIIGGLSK